MGTGILFTSGKGGTGKSTAVAATGSCLAALGARVLCMDLDLHLPNLDLLLGLSSNSAHTIADVAADRASLLDAVIVHPQIENLSLLSGSSDALKDLDAKTWGRILQEAKLHYNYCLIDTPAGIGDLFFRTANGADRAVVVTNMDAGSQRDAQRTVQELDALGFEEISMIVNRVRPYLLTRFAGNVDDMIDFVGATLLGIIPEDKKVLIEAMRTRPLVLYSRRRAASAFLRVAKRLTGESVPIKYL